MDQVQFSPISGAASATAGTAMLIHNGYTFANTIQAIDLDVAQIGLTISSPYANHTPSFRPISTALRRSSPPRAIAIYC
jgi:hypothetical protein